MTRPAASVVILAWNAWEKTRVCLETLRPTLGWDDEVIVVDNGSQDDTPTELARMPWLRVLTNAENQGFAAGCNQGAAAARNPVVVFLNNDTVLSPSWLDGLLAPFDEPDVVAVGPRSNFVSGHQLIDDAAAYRPKTLFDVHDFAWEWRQRHRGERQDVVRLVGFCLAVRRAAFQEIDGFDEAFGLGGCEDDDLCLRLIRAGGRLVRVDDVFVHHEGHQTFDANGVDWQEEQQRNFALLQAKHPFDASAVPAPLRPLPPLPAPADAGTDPAPLVTAVIGTLNRPSLLRRALDSIARQIGLDLLTEVEVVVVNDGGVDVSNVVNEFAGRLTVRLITHEVNRGRSIAYSNGIAAARGRYVSFLADDDVWYPHHLVTLVSALEQADHPTAVYAPAVKVIEDADGRELGRQLADWQEFDRGWLLTTNFICGSTLAAPADALRQAGGYDPELDVLEDWDLWLRLAHLVEWKLVPVPTGEYRMRAPDSTARGEASANSTVREFFRYHPALLYVYDRHPVPAGTVVAAQREHAVTMSQARLDAYGFDVSAVVHCGASLPDTVTTLQSVAKVLAGGRWELVLLVPDMASYQPILSALEGDLQVYTVGDASSEDAFRLAERKTGGRHVLLLRAGEQADPTKVLTALQGRRGTAHEVGIRPGTVPAPRREVPAQPSSRLASS